MHNLDGLHIFVFLKLLTAQGHFPKTVERIEKFMRCIDKISYTYIRMKQVSSDTRLHGVYTTFGAYACGTKSPILKRCVKRFKMFP